MSDYYDDKSYDTAEDQICEMENCIHSMQSVIEQQAAEIKFRDNMIAQLSSECGNKIKEQAEIIRNLELKEVKSAASILGSIKTEKKAKSSAENGKKGGRPRKVV